MELAPDLTLSFVSLCIKGHLPSYEVRSKPGETAGKNVTGKPELFV